MSDLFIIGALVWLWPGQSVWAAGSSTFTLSIIVNFVLLVVGLVYVLRKPIGEALTGRHDGVKKAVDEAEELRRKVERMVKEYEAKLANLDTEMAQILAEAKAAGEKERQEILARAQRMADKIREDAARRAKKEMDKMRNELEQDLVAQAIQEALTLLRKRVSEKDHQVFTQHLITHLEEGNGRGH